MLAIEAGSTATLQEFRYLRKPNWFVSLLKLGTLAIINYINTFFCAILTIVLRDEGRHSSRSVKRRLWLREYFSNRLRKGAGVWATSLSLMITTHWKFG